MTSRGKSPERRRRKRKSQLSQIMSDHSDYYCPSCILEAREKYASSFDSPSSILNAAQASIIQPNSRIGRLHYVSRSIPDRVQMYVHPSGLFGLDMTSPKVASSSIRSPIIPSSKIKENILFNTSNHYLSSIVQRSPYTNSNAQLIPLQQINKYLNYMRFDRASRALRENCLTPEHVKFFKYLLPAEDFDQFRRSVVKPPFFEKFKHGFFTQDAKRPIHLIAPPNTKSRETATSFFNQFLNHSQDVNPKDILNMLLAAQGNLETLYQNRSNHEVHHDLPRYSCHSDSHHLHRPPHQHHHHHHHHHHNTHPISPHDAQQSCHPDHYLNHRYGFHRDSNFHHDVDVFQRNRKKEDTVQSFPKDTGSNISKITLKPHLMLGSPGQTCQAVIPRFSSRKSVPEDKFYKKEVISKYPRRPFHNRNTQKLDISSILPKRKSLWNAEEVFPTFYDFILQSYMEYIRQAQEKNSIQKMYMQLNHPDLVALVRHPELSLLASAVGSGCRNTIRYRDSPMIGLRKLSDGWSKLQRRELPPSYYTCSALLSRRVFNNFPEHSPKELVSSPLLYPPRYEKSRSSPCIKRSSSSLSSCSSSSSSYCYSSCSSLCSSAQSFPVVKGKYKDNKRSQAFSFHSLGQTKNFTASTQTNLREDHLLAKTPTPQNENFKALNTTCLFSLSPDDQDGGLMKKSNEKVSSLLKFNKETCVIIQILDKNYLNEEKPKDSMVTNHFPAFPNLNVSALDSSNREAELLQRDSHKRMNLHEKSSDSSSPKQFEKNDFNNLSNFRKHQIRHDVDNTSDLSNQNTVHSQLGFGLDSSSSTKSLLVESKKAFPAKPWEEEKEEQEEKHPTLIHEIHQEKGESGSFMQLSKQKELNSSITSDINSTSSASCSGGSLTKDSVRNLSNSLNEKSQFKSTHSLFIRSDYSLSEDVPEENSGNPETKQGIHLMSHDNDDARKELFVDDPVNLKALEESKFSSEPKMTHFSLSRWVPKTQSSKAIYVKEMTTPLKKQLDHLSDNVLARGVALQESLPQIMKKTVRKKFNYSEASPQKKIERKKFILSKAALPDVKKQVGGPSFLWNDSLITPNCSTISLKSHNAIHELPKTLYKNGILIKSSQEIIAKLENAKANKQWSHFGQAEGLSKQVVLHKLNEERNFKANYLNLYNSNQSVKQKMSGHPENGLGWNHSKKGLPFHFKPTPLETSRPFQKTYFTPVKPKKKEPLPLRLVFGRNMELRPPCMSSLLPPPEAKLNGLKYSSENAPKKLQRNKTSESSFLSDYKDSPSSFLLPNHNGLNSVHPIPERTQQEHLPLQQQQHDVGIPQPTPLKIPLNTKHPILKHRLNVLRKRIPNQKLKNRRILGRLLGPPGHKIKQPPCPPPKLLTGSKAPYQNSYLCYSSSTEMSKLEENASQNSYQSGTQESKSSHDLNSSRVSEFVSSKKNESLENPIFPEHEEIGRLLEEALHHRNLKKIKRYIIQLENLLKQMKTRLKKQDEMYSNEKQLRSSLQNKYNLLQNEKTDLEKTEKQLQSLLSLKTQQMTLSWEKCKEVEVGVNQMEEKFKMLNLRLKQATLDHLECQKKLQQKENDIREFDSVKQEMERKIQSNEFRISEYKNRLNRADLLLSYRSSLLKEVTKRLEKKIEEIGILQKRSREHQEFLHYINERFRNIQTSSLTADEKNLISEFIKHMEQDHSRSLFQEHQSLSVRLNRALSASHYSESEVQKREL